MNLPAELFEEMTNAVNIVGRDQPRAADRRSPRVQLSSHLSVAKWSDPTFPLGVRIRDFSAGGIGIFHNQCMALDDKLLIRFPRPQNQSILMLGTVVYWEPLSEHLFGIGVQFERMVEESEVARQSEQNVREQIKTHRIGVVARVAQAVARTWRIAS